MYDSASNATRMIGAMIDITERKRAEELARKAEQRYRDIFENTLEGIYQSIPSGRFIEANPAMAKMFGYDSPEDLINSISDLSTQIYFNPEERL